MGGAAVLGGLAATLVLGGLGGVHLLRAATGCQTQYPSPASRAVETAAFPRFWIPSDQMDAATRAHQLAMIVRETWSGGASNFSCDAVHLADKFVESRPISRSMRRTRNTEESVPAPNLRLNHGSVAAEPLLRALAEILEF